MIKSKDEEADYKDSGDYWGTKFLLFTEIVTKLLAVL